MSNNGDSNYALTGHTHTEFGSMPHLYMHYINVECTKTYEQWFLTFMLPTTSSTAYTTWAQLGEDLNGRSPSEFQGCPAFVGGQHRLKPSSTDSGYVYGPILYIQSPNKSNVYVRNDTYNLYKGTLSTKTHSDYDVLDAADLNVTDVVVQIF